LLLDIDLDKNNKLSQKIALQQMLKENF